MSISTKVLNQVAAGKINLDQIAISLDVEKKSVVKATQVLKRRGLIDVANSKTKFDTEIRGIYSLTESGRMWVESGKPISPGQGARPRVSTDGLRKRVWWHIRAYRTASIKELLVSYSEGTKKDDKTTIFKYLSALENAEVLQRSARRLPAKQGKGSVQWYLAVDLGPQPPVWRQEEKTVYDPNSGCKYPTSDSTSLEQLVIQTMRREFDRAKEELQESFKDIDYDLKDYCMDLVKTFRLYLGYSGTNKETVCANLFVKCQTKRGIEEVNWPKLFTCDFTDAQFRLTFGLWILKAISRLNEEAIVPDLSLASLCRILKLTGFVVQKSLYPAWDQATDKTWKWRSKVLPEICEMARVISADIYFVENADIFYKDRVKNYHLAADEFLKTEVVGLNSKLSLLLALNPGGNMFVKIADGPIKAEVFREFLEQILLVANKSILLVLEPNVILNSKLIKEFVEAEKHRLRLYYISAPN